MKTYKVIFGIGTTCSLGWYAPQPWEGLWDSLSEEERQSIIKKNAKIGCAMGWKKKIMRSTQKKKVEKYEERWVNEGNFELCESTSFSFPLALIMVSLSFFICVCICECVCEWLADWHLFVVLLWHGIHTRVEMYMSLAWVNWTPVCPFLCTSVLSFILGHQSGRRFMRVSMVNSHPSSILTKTTIPICHWSFFPSE